jgi:hypothetical protein
LVEQSGIAKIFSILTFIFDGQEASFDILEKIQANGRLNDFDIVSLATIQHDQKGNRSFHVPNRADQNSVDSGEGNGLLALVGGPVGILAMVAAGSALSDGAEKYLGRGISRGELAEIHEALIPDRSAILVLLDQSRIEVIIDDLEEFFPCVIVFTISPWLSAEIERYQVARRVPIQ